MLKNLRLQAFAYICFCWCYEIYCERVNERATVEMHACVFVCVCKTIPILTQRQTQTHTSIMIVREYIFVRRKIKLGVLHIMIIHIFFRFI